MKKILLLACLVLFGCISSQSGSLPQKNWTSQVCGNCDGRGKIKCIVCNGEGEFGICDNYWNNHTSKNRATCQGGCFPCPECKGKDWSRMSAIGCYTCNNDGNFLCTLCQGSGMKPCTTCGGKIEESYSMKMAFRGSKGSGFYVCPVCHGTGKPSLGFGEFMIPLAGD